VSLPHSKYDSAYRASIINGILRFKINHFQWWAGKANYYALIGQNELVSETLELALN
jgi:hypothetical protein